MSKSTDTRSAVDNRIDCIVEAACETGRYAAECYDMESTGKGHVSLHSPSITTDLGAVDDHDVHPAPDVDNWSDCYHAEETNKVP